MIKLNTILSLNAVSNKRIKIIQYSSCFSHSTYFSFHVIFSVKVFRYFRLSELPINLKIVTLTTH
jgi:hypothetical protein